MKNIHFINIKFGWDVVIFRKLFLESKGHNLRKINLRFRNKIVITKSNNVLIYNV